ncbi:efflux RND transporter periplasmic adaptor subunit [Thermosulfuriphilus ammonigenes]|uniref:Efflux RND transporter periplasmic adaptor subunit n=1 Tax=Thermosulfuriphilus ammonigenes TaxID=1936021 RepID=A0A6G7PX94_9BACT|nr:efflux RND transporter periplasmic adaptor subunit [Thermosulfuriphilus ammonigenes]MBA2849700.1 cobalt-zinc-cadmium efflux system membrane fusion protein [Thermosulfuriphilus ammonigenes]QIJ72207.1 efflux RND transporter periplasmic adaptor subunit [Thermosulfuriphilus ammonigenes]
MDRKSIIILVIIALIATAGLTALWLGRQEEKQPQLEKSEEAHAEEQIVRLSPEELREFGVKTDIAGPREIPVYLDLPGEVNFNADLLAHIVPRISGVVRKVYRGLGEDVSRGETLAIIDSLELADLKASYLAAKERLALAEANFKREKILWEKKISSQQDYLNAKQALAEARINLRALRQKLLALGFSTEYLRTLKESNNSLGRYEIKAPFSGTIIEKHITPGERVEANTVIFSLADLSTVWVMISVYRKDLPYCRPGQKVVLVAGENILRAEGVIDYVSPLLEERTRTARARVVLPNPEGLWRPGMLVKAHILVKTITPKVAVPKSALQTIDGKTCVFVREPDGFRPRPVTTGQEGENLVEILSGLKPGEEYVSFGAFILKGELEKESFGDEH